jgi:hypothetical protein
VFLNITHLVLINKRGCGRLMKALHVPAERWQSSLSSDVFGRVTTVATLAARERAAAPPQPGLLGPGTTIPSGPYHRRPDQPTRDQPAPAAKRAAKWAAKR